MRRFFSICLLGLIAGPALARDFPDVDKLPASKDYPDPLTFLDGSKVKTKADWVEKRRPELKALFQHYMYGFAPEDPRNVKGKVEREDRKFFGGKATKREVTITYGPEGTPPIHLLLVIPNDRPKLAPCFVGMNFEGNHALVKDPTVALPKVWMYPNRKGVKDNQATDEGRGTAVDVWALEQSIDRGYAVATFYSGDVDPDRKDVRQGVQKVYAEKGLFKPGPNSWGTIRAWAWGISRVVDYLGTVKEIDPRRLIVVGHSRLGKTALLAAALDERIALAIPHQAGCGGTAPSRTEARGVETVERINTSFPHWFNDNFKKFNRATEKLPFDQHCLAALVAPRPLLYTNAVQDQWANPAGQFDMLRLAEPVYRLLGAGGLKDEKMPPPGKLSDGVLGYYIREGRHSMTPDDWKVFLDFADRHLGKAK